MKIASAEAKLDLYKQFKDEYKATLKPVIVKVSPARYLTVTGKGRPDGPAFQEALGELYGAAYTIKMTRKFQGQDYKVSKLEGLWWIEGKPQSEFKNTSPDNWHWTLMIRVPDFISSPDLIEAKAHRAAKGKEPKKVQLENLNEGECVQILHEGPYDNEEESIAKMHLFAKEKGLEPYGKHHEIYLSDPRKVPAEKLKTILRHPVR